MTSNKYSITVIYRGTIDESGSKNEISCGYSSDPISSPSCANEMVRPRPRKMERRPLKPIGDFVFHHNRPT
jgi:hypothetical protein